MVDEKVFDFIYSMALNDAMNRVSKEGDKSKLAGNKGIKEEVKKYANNIISGNETDLKTTINEIKRINKDSEKQIENFTFGKIQKLINMTMKYLYIKYSENDVVKKNYMACHAPMDSIMRDFVYESYYMLYPEKPKNSIGFTKECSWSGIDSRDKIMEYYAFQSAINDIIKKKNLHISHIEFDYKYWGEASKIFKEEKKISEKIKELLEKSEH